MELAFREREPLAVPRGQESVWTPGDCRETDRLLQRRKEALSTGESGPLVWIPRPEEYPQTDFVCAATAPADTFMWASAVRGEPGVPGDFASAVMKSRARGRTWHQAYSVPAGDAFCSIGSLACPDTSHVWVTPDPDMVSQSMGSGCTTACQSQLGQFTNFEPEIECTCAGGAHDYA